MSQRRSESNFACNFRPVKAKKKPQQSPADPASITRANKAVAKAQRARGILSEERQPDAQSSQKQPGIAVVYLSEAVLILASDPEPTPPPFKLQERGSDCCSEGTQNH